MFCRKCGTENLPDSNFCTKCGSELITKIEPKEQAPAKEEVIAKKQEAVVSDSTQMTQTQTTASNMIFKNKPYNENAHPGIIESTKLMFKDVFTYDKRMGRADYWYGSLGLALINLFVLFVLLGCLSDATDPDAVAFIMFIFIIIAITDFLITLAATVRRLHDIAMSGAWVLLKLVPFGELILLMFTCESSVQKDNPYVIEHRWAMPSEQEKASGLSKTNANEVTEYKTTSVDQVTPGGQVTMAKPKSNFVFEIIGIIFLIGIILTVVVTSVANSHSDSGEDYNDNTIEYYNDTDD